MNRKPTLLLTMGDVGGVGPEIIARAWAQLQPLARPIVVGDPGCMRRAARLVGAPVRVQAVKQVAAASADEETIPCLPATGQDLAGVRPGQVDARAGRAAYDFLCRAIDETVAGEADGIVTAPIHKEGLRAAGLACPGHTEILAERTGTRNFAMALYADGLA